jgi:tryptophanyl-tRNA synthetase
MDLQDPTVKMSTTGGSEAGRVYVDEDEASIHKKFKSAVTDSGSEVVRAPDKPGIANLIEIFAVARGVAPEEIEREFADMGYGAFKLAVAESVALYLAPVRERFMMLRGDEARLEGVLSEGAGRARAISSEVVGEVRRRMGVGAPG